MDIFIYGTGGHAKVVFDTVQTMNGYNVVCFIDDLSKQESFLDLPVLKIPEAIKLTKTGIIAIGSNFIRDKVVNEILLINSNIKFITAIHSNAKVSELAKIESGAVIMAGAIVNAGAMIGSHCVLNTGAILEHDCVMKPFASLAPGVIVGGNVEVGQRSFIALGSQIKHGLKIGDDTVVGMGSIVVANVPSNKIAFGSPCKVIKERTKEEPYL